ncbi:MAG TPA: nuclear transport factor 2 family protein [Gemmatimonadota bacterium]|nr:nuclear transport factor 2 family protein [Gemmatimonadota bacterium]
MRTGRLAATAALALYACSGPREAPPPAGPAGTDSAAVELAALIERYQATYRRGDLRALAELHTQEYLELGPRGEVLTRAGIDSAAADTLLPRVEQQIEIRAEEWAVAESGDLAYGTGTSTVLGSGPDGVPVVVETRWLAGFRRTDGEWRIDRLMTSLPMGVSPDGGGSAGPADGASPR